MERIRKRRAPELVSCAAISSVNLLFCWVCRAEAQIFDLVRSQRFDQSHFVINPDPPESFDLFGRALGAGDFNCDGVDDLAVTAAGEDLTVHQTPDPPLLLREVGLVQVLYGTSSGLEAAAGQTVFESDLGGSSEHGDHFGWSLAVGDFDQDLCDDLAIGGHLENVGEVIDAGVVHVVYGSPAGLDLETAQAWAHGSGVFGALQVSGRFGEVLRTGDVNGDGYDELIVGVPAWEVFGQPLAGGIWLLQGGPSGLQPDNGGWVQHLDQSSTSVADQAEEGDRFGFSLALCDFDRDGFQDLAVGSPGESHFFLGSGALHVFFGSADGVTGLHEHDVVLYGPGQEVYRGEALAAAVTDVTRGCSLTDGEPSAEISQQGETVSNAGRLLIAHRTSNGQWPNSALRQGQMAVHYTASGFEVEEQGDRFGEVVAYGDFDRNGLADLVIGVPREDLPGGRDQGVVHLLLGGRTHGDQALAVRRSDLPASQLGDEDQFGQALAVGDFDGDGADDLAIGIPFESFESDGMELDSAGSVVVLYSAAVFSDGFESGDTTSWSSTTL